ncbi:bacterio-opsin activator domain-containing protein [Natrinema hispanicum]|uniref:PAS domain S-box-containing protein n=1 Tax=Natrinema hispanicum TaxID=392421 RepID=A0A1I0FPS1_9EURY|nr:bacterio-opsin activator domain-containing protein [Natrinema hispanicum]SDC77044.1 PAS domain S-box-containing protein [Natrinema hispanicum]SET60107.1 PAS domain S-box-containing protein [Natrinema hispanicum]
MANDSSDRTVTSGEQSFAFDLEISELSALVSDCAIALFDADGVITAWNAGARHLTGYDAETIVGEHYRSLFPAAAREDGRPDQLLEQTRAEGTVEDDGWRLGGGDSRLWVCEAVATIHADGDVGVPVASAADLDGYLWFVRDRTADHERARELREEKAFTESVLRAQPDILYAYDTDGNLIQWNDQFERVTGYEPETSAAIDPVTFIAPEDRDHIGDTIERILEHGERLTAEGRVLTTDDDRIPYEFNSARIVDDGDVLGFTGVGRDISDRKARERELERLERLNAVIRTIDDTMVTADTRDEVETAIVETFAANDAYRFGVIGRARGVATGEGDSWEPTARAGIDAAAADVCSSFVDPPVDADGESALETRTVRRYRALRESSIEQWRHHAREHDYGAVAVVPIAASNQPLGALVIGAAEPSAFPDREREVLHEFGGTIGHAINVMAVRRLLYQDTVVELEFESTDRGDACIRLSDELGCELSVDHVLPLTGEVFIYYLTASNVDPDRVRELARDDETITDYRLIDADSDESYWECVVRNATIAETVTGYGARLRSKTVRDGVAKLTVQVSSDVALQEFVNTITSAYPDSRLRSKRTVERPVETRGDFRRTVESMLTDKQRIALESAYHGGYFEWPSRHSNAEEIADQLGIARQTFHQHLRVAQAKLLSAYFGDAD